MRQPWLSRVIESPALEALANTLAEKGRAVAEGAHGSSTTLLAGALAVRMARPVLLVVAHLDDADDALEDLELFKSAGFDLDTRRFGALEVLPGESAINLELLAERLAVVGHLVASSQASSLKPQAPPLPGVLIASIQALMQSVPEASALSDFSLTLKPGLQLAPAALLDWLDRAGYSRVEVIEQPGDFATRGGIIDIYPPGSVPGQGPTPIRLDYFGDEIDTLTLIDTSTMGSGPKLESVQVIGASAQRLQSDQRTTSLLQLLPKDTLVVLTEVLELAEQARGYYERLTNPRGIYAPNAVLKSLTELAHVQVNQYSAAADKSQVVKLPVRPLMSFDHEAKKAIAELGELAGNATSAQAPHGHAGLRSVVVLCQNEGERNRLTELLREDAPGRADEVAIEMGYLHRGFVWEEAGSPAATIHLVPHHELFHRYLTRRRIRRISLAADKASDAFLDLEVGDYVVHVDHGIAKFVGLKTMRTRLRTRKGGTEASEASPTASEEYLTLEFANRAMLHVPATQIELVQKYIGGFQGRPPLSVLGGKRWAKQKEAVAEAVKDLAAEMLRVHAARSSLPGVRYPADTAWQREFETEFPYEETDDQLAAIAEVKKDMGDEQPMDRLICGDVGFGKTEVAIRAAFKAIEFGKQVAVLVPTTVLADQHERTFQGRMADYPFRVESISRFKTGGEQAKVLRDLSKGQLDIVIGTHRLLSGDVKFKDLGLVIIDEEQRFGVEHKQKLLQFRLTADVLTLTATPIPRTLHMAMLGLRDISSLSTPPLDRRAIVTEVMPYDRKRVQQALVRELSRDGQVFFVHNRVHNIQSIADEVQKLAPKARVIVGHGQMPGHDLEEVMLKFIRREADILVCTTIIESGIDIPTANTIFINDADHFGLADLHQLRGRVGRYKHRAYCYLLLPEDRPITDTAQRRLKAIEQYSMLGAGFRIAMRDLEIRGAGNLLGAEQSGHIAAVGYEMYCSLLEQQARKLRHETLVEPVRTHLELPLPAGGARIAPAYIASEKYRMEAYKRLSRATSLAELADVVRQLTEAYGEPPAPALALFDLTELRIAASSLGVEAIKLDGPDVIFRTPNPRKLEPLLKDAPGRVSLIDERTVYYRPPTNYIDEPGTLMAVLRKLLVRPVAAWEAGAAGAHSKIADTATSNPGNTSPPLR